jgi:hypothetical protein
MDLFELFPHGWDYAWLATDSEGHVGIFTNAGEGPIPIALLAVREVADRAETLINGLPERGGASILVSLPRSDDFLGFAKRGLFAYDWRDVHRTSHPTHNYELLARPASPLPIQETNADIEMLARIVRLASLRFSASSCIPVSEHVDCYTAVLLPRTLSDQNID